MIRSRQQTLNVYGAFDALEFEHHPSRRPASRTHASYDSLRVVRLGADYALSDICARAESLGDQRALGAPVARA